MYQESYSAIRKALADCTFLILIFILTLGGSFMIFNGDTAGKPPDAIRIFLTGVSFIVSIIILYGFFHQIKRIFSFRGDWKITIDGDVLKLETPDNEEVEPFEYKCKEIKKFSREAYENDGVCYRWFIFFEENGQEIKKKFDLVPFSEEKVVNRLMSMYSIDAVEIDIKGSESKWYYSFISAIKTSSGYLFGAVIFLLFLIPSIFYLLKLVAALGG